MTPATSVGTANGRSTTVESRSLPGNGTRTKMYASSVPNTPLMIAVRKAIIRVSLIAFWAPNEFSASWRLPTPLPKPLCSTAATGSTMNRPRSRNAVPRSDQRPSAAPVRSRERALDRCWTVACTAIVLALRCLERLGERPARAEHGVARQLVPAAQVVRGEQILDRRVLGAAALLGGSDVDRPLVAHRLEDSLRLGRVQVLHERGCDRRDAVLLRLRVDHHGRRLDRDRRRRDHELILAARGDAGQRLVLVRDRDVTVAGLEVLERVVGALVEHGHVLEDALEQLLGAGGIVRRVPG